MTASSQPDAPGSEPPKTEKAIAPFDRWLAYGLLAAGAVFFYETFYFRTFDWDPVGMAFWPRVLLAVLAVVSVWHIVIGNTGGATMEPFSRRAFVLFGGGTVYVLLLDTIGFFLITPVAIFAYSLWLRPLNAKAVVGAAILATAGTSFIFLIFEFGMSVYLPRGILE